MFWKTASFGMIAQEQVPFRCLVIKQGLDWITDFPAHDKKTASEIHYLRTPMVSEWRHQCEIFTGQWGQHMG